MLKKLILLITVLCFCLLGNHLFAQDNSTIEKGADPNRDYALKYLKSFESFVTNPDSFFVHGQRNLLLFDNTKAKRIHNFMSPKKRFKGRITPDSLYKHIVNYFPDGLGMVYKPDSLEYIAKKKSFANPVYAYKVPVEFSGFRKDGSLQSYQYDQYIYVKTDKESNRSITAVQNDRYHKKKFGKQIFREGFLMEARVNAFNTQVNVSHNQYFDGFIDCTYADFYYDWGYDWENPYRVTETSVNYGRAAYFNSFSNYGLDFIYMLKPFLGFGFGVSTYNYAPTYDIELANYQLPEIAGYIPTIYTGTRGLFDETNEGWYYDFQYQSHLEHRINISTAALPLFIRLQLGGKVLSFSTDLGLIYIPAPRYDSYLDGTVRYFGISTSTGELVTSNPSMGFGTYSYDNELVHSYQAENSQTLLFARANLSIQPSKYFYFNFSYSFHSLVELEYTEQWHMWDMYALRLPNADDMKGYNNLNIEFGVGLNLNNIFLK
ncbi:MAG: hypothetical protein ACLFNU_03910 [Bacteroidales bacterium]